MVLGGLNMNLVLVISILVAAHDFGKFNSQQDRVLVLCTTPWANGFLWQPLWNKRKGGDGIKTVVELQ